MAHDTSESNPLETALDFYVGELKDDSAAVRSVRRKFDELQDRLYLAEISVANALSELHSEFDACLPDDRS